MDYKGYKSQPLDFVTYQDGQDGVNITAVTPQYALTRENTDKGEIQYYSTTSGWKGLTVETTVEKALASIQGDGQDAWWVGDSFKTLLDEYWNKDNAYSNTLWTREETTYDGGKPTTYSDPRKDAGGSAISQWCLDNDRTLINGAHIATGTVTAQQIDTGLLNAAGVVVASSGSSDTGLLKPTEETLAISDVIQPMPASGNITVDSAMNTYTLTLTAAHAGLRLNLTKFVENQTYRLKFKFTDLCNTNTGEAMDAVPVTYLGGNIGWPVANFRLLKAAIDGSPIEDPSLYDSTGYVLNKDAGHEYDIELEFAYLGMNNAGDTTSADNYFYISPNRCLDNPKQQTYTQITITEISCVSRSVLQYIWISQGTFITPTETDRNWQNEFPEWEGMGSVWRRSVTEVSDVNGEVIYNYSPAQLLTAGECARIMTEAAIAKGEEWTGADGNKYPIESLGDWCKKYEVTILDGSNLMTGTIDASEITVTNLDASQITTGTIDAREINVTNIDASNITAGMFTVGVDGPDEDKDLGGSEIVFQAGYDENDEPLVKIGGFVVDTNSLQSNSPRFIPDTTVSQITTIFKVYTDDKTGEEAHNKYLFDQQGGEIFSTSSLYNPAELPETVYSNILDYNLQKAAQSAPTILTEFTKDGLPFGQLLIYSSNIATDLDNDGNTETYNVWDKLYYNGGKWDSDIDKIWTNVVVTSPDVYLGTDKIELLSGDNCFRVKDGEIFANAGAIGGFTIDANSIASGDVDKGTGIQLTSGVTGAQKVIRAGKNFSVDAKGDITANGGTIGGWTINKTALSAEKTSDPSVKVGLSVPQDGIDDNENYVIWAGGENGASSPFSVALDGTISINKGGLNLSTDEVVEKSTTGFLGIGGGKQINRATFVTQPTKSILVNNRYDGALAQDSWINTVCFGVRGVPDYVRGGTLDIQETDYDGTSQPFYAGGLTISSDSRTAHSGTDPNTGTSYGLKTSAKTAFIQAQANSSYQAYNSGAKLIVGEWNRPVDELNDNGVTIDKDDLNNVTSPAALDAVYITPYTISGSNLGIIGEWSDAEQSVVKTYTKRQITGAADSKVGMCFRSGGGYYSDDWPWAIWAGTESTWGTKAFRVGHGGEVYIKDSLTYKGVKAYSLRYHIFSGVGAEEEVSYDTGATVLAAVACRKQTRKNSKNYSWSVNWDDATIYVTNKAGSGSDDFIVFYLV